VAKVIWTIPALADLERILEYIELDNLDAAKRLAKRVFRKVDRLEGFPNSGAKPKELKGTPYKRIYESPVYVYYRLDGDQVYIVHVDRVERDFSLERIEKHEG
jgi:toxin ParE1/3/4